MNGEMKEGGFGEPELFIRICRGRRSFEGSETGKLGVRGPLTFYRKRLKRWIFFFFFFPIFSLAEFQPREKWKLNEAVLRLLIS